MEYACYTLGQTAGLLEVSKTRQDMTTTGYMLTRMLYMSLVIMLSSEVGGWLHGHGMAAYVAVVTTPPPPIPPN
jgi:hypothetical protein